MTKAREHLTFAHAVTRIASRLGWNEAGEACGKGERTVRLWSEPDVDRWPDINECLALDAAFLKAGGGEAPLLAVYQARLEMATTPAADSMDLARSTATVAREAGEAIAALVVASQPGAPPRDRIVAGKEVGEAIEALTEVQRKLGDPTVTQFRAA